MRGSYDQADLIHQLVTQRLIEKLQDPEVSPADIDKALKFLKDNGITKFSHPEGEETAEDLLGGLSRFRPDLPELDEEDDDEPVAL